MSKMVSVKINNNSTRTLVDSDISYKKMFSDVPKSMLQNKTVYLIGYIFY